MAIATDPDSLARTREAADELPHRRNALQGLLGRLLENYARNGAPISKTSRDALKSVAANLEAYGRYLDQVVDEIPEKATVQAANIINKYRQIDEISGLD